MAVMHYIGLLLPFFLIIYKLVSNRFQQKNLPPGPPSLPILGHFHLLKRPLHLFFHNLSCKYGPILFLRFGPRPVLVISNPSAIEECFTKNDILFANRPLFASRKVLDYDFARLGVAPYGEHWRNLRRLTATEIFSSTRLQMSSSIRGEEIHFLVKQIFGSSLEGEQKLEIGSLFYMLTFNIMMQLVAGNRYFDDEFNSYGTRDRINDLRQLFTPAAKLLVSDHFPILRKLTFYKVEEEVMEVHRGREKFVHDLINSCKNNKSCGEKRPALIDVMLSLQELEPDVYTDRVIKGVLVDMLIAGTETSASTMESAVSHLITHPEVFTKARKEIDNIIGQSQLLDDSVLSTLPFLYCIIYETLRLGSTGPIIPPHESSEKCTVGGYDIPRGTMLLVNTWTLYRDPKLWVDPDMFKPERFQGNEVENGGYKFIPFGSGRRQCPGSGLALRLMALSLGTLIQCFEWQKPGEHYEDANLNREEKGPPRVTFRPRDSLASALSQL